MEEDPEILLRLCGSSTIGRTSNPELSSTPTYNKCLALLTAGIVSVVISNKTGLVEWHAARGGSVSYASDFLASWPRSDLIISSSTGVLIKIGVLKEIGVANLVGKGKEKEVKKEVGKKSEAQEGVEGIELAKVPRKGKLLQLVSSLLSPGKVDSSAARKEVSHPPIPKIRVKTKVETSIL